MFLLWSRTFEHGSLCRLTQFLAHFFISGFICQPWKFLLGIYSVCSPWWWRSPSEYLCGFEYTKSTCWDCQFWSFQPQARSSEFCLRAGGREVAEVSGDGSTRHHCLVFRRTNLLRNVHSAHSYTADAINHHYGHFFVWLERRTLSCGFSLSWGFLVRKCFMDDLPVTDAKRSGRYLRLAFLKVWLVYVASFNTIFCTCNSWFDSFAAINLARFARRRMRCSDFFVLSSDVYTSVFPSLCHLLFSAFTGSDKIFKILNKNRFLSWGETNSWPNTASTMVESER